MAQQTENLDWRLSAQDAASPVFRDTQRALNGLAKQAFDAKAILGTLGAAVSSQQFVSMILGATETTAHYKDLAEIAGTTAAKISGLEEPARLAGTSLNTIATSVARLGRSIGEARLGDTGKASLFKALGIDVNDGRDAADVMVDVAKALSGMTDQTVAGKVASDLLGRSYAELRPFLRELTEQGGLHARVTNEQTEAADRFRDNLSRVSLSIDQAKINLGNELLPVLNEVAQAWADNRKELESLPTAGAAARTLFETLVVLGANVAFTFKMVGGEIGVIAAQVAALGRGDFAGFRLIGEEWTRDAAAARAELDAFEKKVLSVGKTIAEQRDNFDLMGNVDKLKGAGGDAEQRVRERMEFEKHYQERVAAAQGFYNRYADAIKVGAELAQEAQKQGFLGTSEIIEQQRASEDARLQVLIISLQQQRALHQQMGEIAQARIAQEKIAGAEAARMANDAIAGAKQTSLAAIQEQQFRDLWAQKVERIQTENKTEMELLNVGLAAKQEALVMSFLTEEEYARQSALVFRNYEKAKTDIESREQQARLAGAANAFGNLATLMGSHSRKLFEVGKVAAIAETIIHTISAAQKAFDEGSNVSIWLGAAYAAAVTAAGMLRVQQIHSQNFGGGGGASPVYDAIPGTGVPSGAVGGGAGPPALPQAAAPRTRMDVTLVNTRPTDKITMQEMVDDIFPLMQEALDNGADLRLTFE